MRKLIWPGLIILCAGVASPPAMASGDVGCSPTMKVFHARFTGCDSMGFLSPGNDTRINLTLLMADTHGQKLTIQRPAAGDGNETGYSPTDWGTFKEALLPTAAATDAGTLGEGTVCVSAELGKAQFLAAVAASDSPAPEKSTLSAARSALQCTPDGPAPALPEVQSAAGKEFLAYLAAITRFYKTDHADPALFSALASASQPWVKDASRYMAARVLLLAAQANAFDEYGTLQKDKIDPAALARARDALNAYLKDVPNGLYATSVTGLLRRAYWLGGDATKQAETYGTLLGASSVDASGLEIVNEVDLKLPVEAYAASASPLLLAVQDLRLMREQRDDNDKPIAGLTAGVLDAQRQRFSAMPDVFDYLRAARAWFVDKDAKAVLEILPATLATADLSYVEFSRQLLRAAARDATGDEAARQDYVALLAFAHAAYHRPALELAIALSDERHKRIGPDFDDPTPITEPVIREQLLNTVAGPIILRQQATSTRAPQEERDTALFRLLSRDLVQGRFKGFLDDIKLLPQKPASTGADAPPDRFAAFRWAGGPSPYPCPGIADVAVNLAANSTDVPARLCLGDFFRETSVADVPVPNKDELGGTGTLFAGAPIFRQDIYIDIMKNPAASRQEKAYALYRAVRCYEPSHINDCGGKDVPQATRKAWHDELKSRYGDTPWARELRYYW